MLEEDIQWLRAECLRYAVESGCPCSDVIETAQKFMGFIERGPPTAEVVQLHEVSNV